MRAKVTNSENKQ